MGGQQWDRYKINDGPEEELTYEMAVMMGLAEVEDRPTEDLSESESDDMGASLEEGVGIGHFGKGYQKLSKPQVLDKEYWVYVIPAASDKSGKAALRAAKKYDSGADYMWDAHDARKLDGLNPIMIDAEGQDLKKIRDDKAFRIIKEHPRSLDSSFFEKKWAMKLAKSLLRESEAGLGESSLLSEGLTSSDVDAWVQRNKGKIPALRKGRVGNDEAAGIMREYERLQKEGPKELKAADSKIRSHLRKGDWRKVRELLDELDIKSEISHAESYGEMKLAKSWRQLLRNVVADRNKMLSKMAAIAKDVEKMKRQYPRLLENPPSRERAREWFDELLVLLARLERFDGMRSDGNIAHHGSDDKRVFDAHDEVLGRSARGILLDIIDGGILDGLPQSKRDISKALKVAEGKVKSMKESGEPRKTLGELLAEQSAPKGGYIYLENRPGLWDHLTSKYKSGVRIDIFRDVIKLTVASKVLFEKLKKDKMLSGMVATDQPVRVDHWTTMSRVRNMVGESEEPKEDELSEAKKDTKTGKAAEALLKKLLEQIQRKHGKQFKGNLRMEPRIDLTYFEGEPEPYLSLEFPNKGYGGESFSVAGHALEGEVDWFVSGPGREVQHVKGTVRDLLSALYKVGLKKYMVESEEEASLEEGLVSKEALYLAKDFVKHLGRYKPGSGMKQLIPSIDGATVYLHLNKKDKGSRAKSIQVTFYGIDEPARIQIPALRIDQDVKKPGLAMGELRKLINSPKVSKWVEKLVWRGEDPFAFLNDIKESSLEEGIRLPKLPKKVNYQASDQDTKHLLKKAEQIYKMLWKHDEGRSVRDQIRLEKEWAKARKMLVNVFFPGGEKVVKGYEKQWVSDEAKRAVPSKLRAVASEAIKSLGRANWSDKKTLRAVALASAAAQEQSPTVNAFLKKAKAARVKMMKAGKPVDGLESALAAGKNISALKQHVDMSTAELRKLLNEEDEMIDIADMMESLKPVEESREGLDGLLCRIEEETAGGFIPASEAVSKLAKVKFNGYKTKNLNNAAVELIPRGGKSNGEKSVFIYIGKDKKGLDVSIGTNEMDRSQREFIAKRFSDVLKAVREYVGKLD